MIVKFLIVVKGRRFTSCQHWTMNMSFQFWVSVLLPRIFSILVLVVQGVPYENYQNEMWPWHLNSALLTNFCLYIDPQKYFGFANIAVLMHGFSIRINFLWKFQKVHSVVTAMVSTSPSLGRFIFYLLTAAYNSNMIAYGILEHLRPSITGSHTKKDTYAFTSVNNYRVLHMKIIKSTL